MTISSAVMETFRMKYLRNPDHTNIRIPIIPQHGYRKYLQDSLISHARLDHIEKYHLPKLADELNIEHDRLVLKRQVGFKNYVYDGGIYRKEGRQLHLLKLYEFHGCYFHAHECMYNRKSNHMTIQPAPAKT